MRSRGTAAAARVPSARIARSAPLPSAAAQREPVGRKYGIPWENVPKTLKLRDLLKKLRKAGW
jgi:hypothetical protein